MNSSVVKRIESIDLLRGIVMVLMALDHTRDFFHKGSMVADATNLATTTPALFFTRILTHYCAPVFVMLTGTSAYLSGRRKTKKELFNFLFSRGLWLILLEFTLNNFVWWFDISFSVINIQVIWAIGFSMVILSFLIFLPLRWLLTIGIVIVAGHNLLDQITMDGTGAGSIAWYLFHQMKEVHFDNRVVFFQYPVLPWIGVMLLGYCLGFLFSDQTDQARRKKWLLALGLSGVLAFILIRGINIYGDSSPWRTQKNGLFTFMSFINVSKYPPSLLYVLMTLSPALLILYATETVKSKLTAFFIVFGQVPLFYYFLHTLVIHLLAILMLIFAGDDWSLMIVTATSITSTKWFDYGYALPIVYMIWIFVIAVLYPLCRMYQQYKFAHREKWWLSYL